MNGENQSLVTDGPVEFENNRLKFKTSGELSSCQKNLWNTFQVMNK